MDTNISDEEWLKRRIEDNSIQFYPFEDLIEPELIRSGGYGVVFKTKQRNLGITVAYKVLEPDKTRLEDFVKEVIVKRV